ncbi:MAG: nuclear transport factor 2 family protein [Jatrophihabitans sp.]|uniref:nuclear transport factor 2 family protein n=1 Tax=Jatrophihabitans sp. TaxID=1932789 RepID=UPI003F7D48F8
MTAQSSNIERDGEHRDFAGHGHADLASAGGLTLLRGVFEPGWRWTQDVAPLAGTDSCQVRHLGYLVSGTMQIREDEGAERTLTAGDLFDLAPGHDAWVVGDQPCIMLDYATEATAYARPATATAPAVDENIALVRRGYAAFNAGDVATLREVIAYDAVQHVPGGSMIAGAYKGVDAILGLYARLAELTGGTFRASLIDVHSDGGAHAVAVHQTSATRNGQTRVARGSILFTIMGGKATDLMELRADLAGDDAFFS